MFSKFMEARAECLSTYNFLDPRGLDLNYYVNLYIHRTDGVDIFADIWKISVGWDENGNAYATIPSKNTDDEEPLFHEAFHLFQSRAISSKGNHHAINTGWDIDYNQGNNDNFWYIEAPASWYAARKIIHRPDAFKRYVVP